MKRHALVSASHKTEGFAARLYLWFRVNKRRLKTSASPSLVLMFYRLHIRLIGNKTNLRRPVLLCLVSIFHFKKEKRFNQINVDRFYWTRRFSSFDGELLSSPLSHSVV